MSNWPPNPYLDAFLRSPEGQSYLEKNGSLDAWRRRHLLDPLDIPVVPSEAVEPGSLLFVPARRPQESDTDLARRSVLVTNVSVPDPWDF